MHEGAAIAAPVTISLTVPLAAQKVDDSPQCVDLEDRDRVVV